MTNHPNHLIPFLDADDDLRDPNTMTAIAALAHCPHIKDLQKLLTKVAQAHARHHLLETLEEGSSPFNHDELLVWAERIDGAIDQALIAVWS